jgi:hypothetical protein
MTSSLRATPLQEKLYALLPRIYQLRDAGQGEPLRALLAIMETQLQRVDDNIGDLYESWFIETCEEWLVPYIGDLLGVRGLFVFDNEITSLRSYVANTLRYRRRKGTAAMLEGLAHDTTGWRAKASELFELLATTQYLNHLRPSDVRTPNLRNTSALELLGGPFERIGHYVDVRRIAVERGRYNVQNVGLFLWRLGSFPVVRQPACRADDAYPLQQVGADPFHFGYRFSPLGADLRLFNQDLTPADLSRLTEAGAPGPLRQRDIYDDLVALRLALKANEPHAPRYFQSPNAVRVWVVDPLDPEPKLRALFPEEIQICDLSAWDVAGGPPPAAPIVGGKNPFVGSSVRVSIDVERGRLAIVDGSHFTEIRLDYCYGFSAPIAGGPYRREATLTPASTHPQGDAAKLYPIDAAAPGSSFQQQFAIWQAESPARSHAVFAFPDEQTYAVVNVTVPAGQHVEIRAADGHRALIDLAGQPWNITVHEGASITFNGLWIEGAAIHIATPASVGSSGDHGITFRHSTLVPGQRLGSDGKPAQPAAASVTFDGAASSGQLSIAFESCISGHLDFTALVDKVASTLAISDSIVDATEGGESAIVEADAVVLQRVTVLGSTSAKTIDASDTIFDGTPVARRTQQGCVRFSYVPRLKSDAPPSTPRSVVGERYRCQPDLALTDATNADAIIDRLKPSFTSRRYGDPGYAQLSTDCPPEIAAGASDGSEMGVFGMLHQPQRLANLRTALDEYLRFGLEAGIFFVT